MFIRACTAAVLIFELTLPVLAQQPGAFSQADAKLAAAKISKAWDDAYNVGRPADIAALFGPDGIYLTPAGTMLKDHQEIEKALANRQNAGWIKERIDVLETRQVGDRVSAIIKYTLIGTGRNADKQIGGYAAEMLSRQGSDWKLDLMAANLSPVPDLIPDVTGMTADVENACPGVC